MQKVSSPMKLTRVLCAYQDVFNLLRRKVKRSVPESAGGETLSSGIAVSHGAGAFKPRVVRDTCHCILTIVALGSSLLASTPISAARTEEEFRFDAARLTWQEYRRDDFGFRIEVPGLPHIEDDTGDEFLKIGTDVTFDRGAFGIEVREFPGRSSPQMSETLDYMARCSQLGFGIESKSRRFTMDGAPGREDIFETKDTIVHYRSVAYGNRVIQIYVFRDIDPAIALAAERFFASFALLPIQ